MQIGPYEVVSILGRGGTGIVYRARSPDGREVAIKVLGRRGGEPVARFERERRLLGSLGEAEGFVSLLDAGESENGPYVVLSLVPGGTLRARLAAGPLGIEETVALGRALGAALGAAHARGIVHRDVKPENVLFAADGRPLLADLGLAKHFDPGAPGGSQSVSLSAEGAFRGTAAYMAREQIDDARSVGPPADVFALGAILYECLAGEPAFGGGSIVNVLARIHAGDRPSPMKLRPQTPEWLDALIMKALSRAPEERFRDGRAFALALAHDSRRKTSRRVLVFASIAALLVASAIVAAKARTPTTVVGEARAAAVLVLRDALDAASSGQPSRALELVRQERRRSPALATEAALEIGKELHESGDWARLATASRLFLSLDTSPGQRRLLEDWQVTAEDMADPEGVDLGNLKRRCEGTDLESSPLRPVFEKLYARALEPTPSVKTLLALYPLPPSAAQREKVAAACLEDMRRINDGGSFPSLEHALQKLGASLDRLQCAHAVDPRIPSLPDELEGCLRATLGFASAAIPVGRLPASWETTFTGGNGRPGFPDHPMRWCLRSRLRFSSGDTSGAVADALRAVESIGLQRTRFARKIAESFVGEANQGSEGSEPAVFSLKKSFAAIADTRRGWVSFADACEALHDPAGASAARARAAKAEDLPE